MLCLKAEIAFDHNDNFTVKKFGRRFDALDVPLHECKLLFWFYECLHVRLACIKFCCNMNSKL